MDQEKIGKFIGERRKKKKITQKEFAELLGVTDKTVSRWENGHYLPDVSLFNDVCEILDIEVAELLKGEKMNKMEKKDVDETIDKIVDISKDEIKKKNKKVIRVSILIILLVFIVCGVVLFLGNGESEPIDLIGMDTRWPSKYAFIEKEDGWVCSVDLEYNRNSDVPHYYGFNCDNYRYNYLYGYMLWAEEMDEYGKFRYEASSNRPPSYIYHDEYNAELDKIEKYFTENKFYKKISVSDLDNLDVSCISKDDIVFLFNKAISNDFYDTYGNFYYMYRQYMNTSKNRDGYVWQLGIDTVKGYITYVNIELFVNGKNLSDLISDGKATTKEKTLYNKIEKIERHILETQTLSLPEDFSYNEICNYLNELFDEVYLIKENYK